MLAASVAGELISSEIEIRSGRGEDLAAALTAQRDHRRRLFALAAQHGVALGATGTHPWSDYRDQHIIDTEHYHRVEEGLKYVAWRNNAFSLHVHVGVRGADRAVQVCDRLRPLLPLLLAISASSPFLDGRDSGLHSARSQIFTRSFPRCGVPDAFGSWSAFAQYIELLVTDPLDRRVHAGVVVGAPHFAFGTVEVRICDAQPTAAESEGLAALIVACVAQLAREIDEGRPGRRPPGRLIEENLWRAIRHGLDGELLELPRGEPFPAQETVERLSAWTAPARAELGLEVALPELNSAQRQRRMIEAGLDMREIYASTVRDTQETYAGVRESEAEVSTMSDQPGPGQPSEEELRAAYEEEIKKIRVEQVLLGARGHPDQPGMRRTGLAPGTEGERDANQVRLAIESVRAQLPLVEQISPEQVGPVRDALSQLQLAFVRIGGQAEGEGAGAPSASPGGRPPGRDPAEPEPPAGPPPPGPPLRRAPRTPGAPEAEERRSGPAQRPAVDPRSVSAGQ